MPESENSPRRRRIFALSSMTTNGCQVNQKRENMIRSFLKKIFMTISYPLRYLIRYELEQQFSMYSMQNLQKGLQRVATEQTVQYINQQMRHVDSVTLPHDLLTDALASAEQGGGRLICEFGVYSGATINHIASQTEETVYGFDSFRGLPERWRDGIGEGSLLQAQHPDVLPNVVLLEGWFDESLPPFLEENPGDVSFLHIDCDLYSSTRLFLISCETASSRVA